MTKRFEEDKVYKRDVDPVILDKVVERYDDYIVVVSKYEDQDEWETNEHIWTITEDPIRGAEIVTIHNGKEIVLDSRDEVQIEDEKLARNRADTCVIKFDDWVRGKEYDAVCLTTNQTFKVEFFKSDEEYEPYNLCFIIKLRNGRNKIFDNFRNLGNFAVSEEAGRDKNQTIIIFKHGINSILNIEKERIEPICFKIGTTYKGFNNESFKCMTIFTSANNEKIGIFYHEEKDAILAQKIKIANNVEYTVFLKTKQLDFIADEKYRDEINNILIGEEKCDLN